MRRWIGASMAALLVAVATARAEEKITVAGLLAEAAGEAEKVDGEFERPEALQTVAYWLARTGEVDKGKKLVLMVTPPERQATAWKAVAVGLAQRGDAAAVRALMGELKDPAAEGMVGQELVGLLAKSGDVPAAKKVVEDTRSQYQKDLMRGTIARAQGVAGDLKGADKTIMQIETGDLKVAAYSELARALVEKGKAAEAKEAVKSARESFKVSKSFAGASLSAIARAEVATGNIAGANQALTETDSKEDQVLIREAIGQELRAMGKEEQAREYLHDADNRLLMWEKMTEVDSLIKDKKLDEAEAKLEEVRKEMAQLAMRAQGGGQAIAAMDATLHGPAAAADRVRKSKSSWEKVAGLCGVVSAMVAGEMRNKGEK